jgi:transcription initiation factor TFIIIB Brf1 subunit/transcription initiation factor TFIIB
MEFKYATIASEYALTIKNYLEGRQHQTIAAVAIYIVGQLIGAEEKRFSRDKIAKISQIAVKTLRKGMSELFERIREQSEDDNVPGGFSL